VWQVLIPLDVAVASSFSTVLCAASLACSPLAFGLHARAAVATASPVVFVTVTVTVIVLSLLLPGVIITWIQATMGLHRQMQATEKARLEAQAAALSDAGGSAAGLVTVALLAPADSGASATAESDADDLAAGGPAAAAHVANGASVQVNGHSTTHLNGGSSSSIAAGVGSPATYGSASTVLGAKINGANGTNGSDGVKVNGVNGTYGLHRQAAGVHGSNDNSPQGKEVVKLGTQK
jgi:hypothetical protein